MRLRLPDRRWRLRAAVCGLVVLWAAPMVLGHGPLAAAGQESVGARREVGAGGIWKDPDGNPLPFRNDEEIIEFLRTADIASISDIDRGVTKPREVVLEKGGVRMRAAMRNYDQTFTEQRIDGVFYGRLRDSYLFDIAVYGLAGVIGLDNIPPVTTRRVGDENVSLQIWLEGGMMEADRIAYDLAPPSALRFRQQTQDMRVFDSVIGNVDRNTGNILLDGDWNFWFIDHSRSFMRNDETRYLERVTACSRWLYERLKALQRDEIMPVMSPPLTTSEVDWVLRRRDKVIAYIDALITERGEGAVLFEDRE